MIERCGVVEEGLGVGSVEVGAIVDFSLLSAVNTQSGKGGGVS